MATPTGYKFLDGGVQKDFADVFDITYPVPGVSTGYKSNPYLGKDLGEIFTAGTGSGKTTHYFNPSGNDLGSIFALINSKVWYALGSGCNEYVNAVAIDGSNNYVYAVGFFTLAGGTSANRIAKWNGSGWTALGSGLDGVPISGSSADVFAIAIDSSSNVYVGGYFTSAGGASANYIAKWDGTVWTALGTGTSGTVFAIAIDSSDNVYVGGDFTSAGGAPANYIAKWDGSWSALGSGTNYVVMSIAIDSSDNVYVGGDFTSAGGAPAYRIAKWDGLWSALGSGTNSVVRSIAIDSSDNVYVGGDFTLAGGSPANHIANWDAFAHYGGWTTLGSGTNNVVRSIAIDSVNNYVYVGGNFTSVGGASANYIANWDAINSTWTTLGSGLAISSGAAGAAAYAIAIDSSNNVYVGGFFTSAGGVLANYIAKYA